MSEITRSRAFGWDDVPQLHELLARWWAADGPRSYVHIGDFSWTLRATPPDDLLRHLRVWIREDGSLSAFACLDAPAAGELILRPNLRLRSGDSEFDAALDWLEEEHRIAGSGSLSIVAMAGDESRAEALRRRRYAPGAGGNVRFWRAIDAAPVTAPLPDGFVVRGVSTDADFERRAYVETASFGGGITGETWRSMTGRLPGYRPELDLIVVAPDATGASACTCWYDAVTRCGEFEAVGTAAALRRRGIGKAVIMEGLRRLHQFGATQAVVQTTIGNAPAIALYQSCGFEVVAKDYRWVKRDG